MWIILFLQAGRRYHLLFCFPWLETGKKSVLPYFRGHLSMKHTTEEKGCLHSYRAAGANRLVARKWEFLLQLPPRSSTAGSLPFLPSLHPPLLPPPALFFSLFLSFSPPLSASLPLCLLPLPFLPTLSPSLNTFSKLLLLLVLPFPWRYSRPASLSSSSSQTYCMKLFNKWHWGFSSTTKVHRSQYPTRDCSIL